MRKLVCLLICLSLVLSIGLVTVFADTTSDNSFGADQAIRALYGEMGLWVRPASMWTEKVERDGYCGPRFQYIGE